jgi:transcription-repair coupling factor (superfamily II helicase)
MASDLNSILQQLISHERIAALAAALREQPRARLHVAPATSAARAALVAALAAQAQHPILYVVGSAEAALRAREDLCLWLDPSAVLLFPASDALPYEPMSPGMDVIAGRLTVLRRLADDRRPTTDDSITPSPAHPLTRSFVVVAPIKALLQPTLAPAEWTAATLRLRRGDEHSPDELVRRWVAMGYRVAPTVEEPGELNRRGGIVDIFPPGDEQPVRIEFFGDEIDGLRRFDPITQRSETQIRESVVGPPHEIPFWRIDTALDRLRALDASELRREAREDWDAALDRLEQGERFEGRALFAPFFRIGTTTDHRPPTTETETQETGLALSENKPIFTRSPAHPLTRSKASISHPASLLAHLPPDAPLIFSELSLLAQQAAEMHRHAEEQRTLQIESGELPPGFPRPYLLWDELLAQAEALSLVNLSNNDSEIRDWRFEIRDSQLRNPQSPISNLDLPDTLFVPADLFGGQLKRVVEDIAGRLRDGEQVAVVTPQAARIQEMVEEATNDHRPPTTDEKDKSSVVGRPSSFVVVHGSLDEGWRAPDLNLTLYTDAEIFGWRQRRPVAERKHRRDRSAEERATFLRGLKPGDYVVHIEHGIALYEGLVRRTVGNIEREYLNLRYAEGDRLYVPVDQVDRVSRYIGAGDAAPTLTRLGTQDWERAKRKARAAVQELANDLLKLYAQRQLSEGFAFAPDGAWQRELEDAFPYIETDDQVRAIVDVKQDMEQPQPMDRLICGDVGFGKTEVALRAAFKAIQDGKQAAVLVPTTVLAQQHYDTFSRRMAAFPVAVEMISRFRSAKEQEQIVGRLARGAIDIIIGTHRLLSKDIGFKDLGLLIVDEEQRFGVRHKERIKQMRANVDVLTLTATPIPRTLHMALAGIRDLSVIDTPPEDRVPIKTYVLPYDEHLVREAILRELDRGGQVYYVHNRVQSIYYVAEKLRRLVPEAEIAVGHGQLEEHQLEKVMLDFFSGKDDVLVCTTIIESGLDVPNANTLIIEDATHYGLAQLYQLRGRVGRSAQRAYAYLFYKEDHRMTPEAQERLQAIQEATELGAGFRIAMRDLEIRGAGNLLGAEQSGHIAAVGFDLYSRLLEQAVKTMKSQLVATNYRMPTTDHRPPTTDEETGDRRRETGDGRQKTENTEQQEATRASKQPSVVGRRSSVVDEKVLVAPLVTLDLPLDAYLPADYIADDRVRLSVYQHMAEAGTPRAVRDLRRELQDRFGKLPDPADHLLTWLLIKALALQASVTSIVTTDEEFIIRLPEAGAPEREKLRRRFDRLTTVRIGPQFARLDRRSLDGKWVEALMNVLETLAK